MNAILEDVVTSAAARMHDWLRALPEWRRHPTNESGSVSAHYGPTVLSEHDCVLHFARFLVDAGVAWEDLHLELSPGQWMFRSRAGVAPKRIDLAIIPRDRLALADFPARLGDYPLDAVFEFALASNYWQFGSGSPRPTVKKVADDIAKTGEYVRTGLARRGYVVVVEECDHGFDRRLVEDARQTSGVEVLLLKRWQ